MKSVTLRHIFSGQNPKSLRLNGRRLTALSVYASQRVTHSLYGRDELGGADEHRVVYSTGDDSAVRTLAFLRRDAAHNEDDHRLVVEWMPRAARLLAC